MYQCAASLVRHDRDASSAPAGQQARPRVLETGPWGRLWDKVKYLSTKLGEHCDPMLHAAFILLCLCVLFRSSRSSRSISAPTPTRRVSPSAQQQQASLAVAACSATRRRQARTETPAAKIVLFLRPLAHPSPAVPLARCRALLVANSLLSPAAGRLPFLLLTLSRRLCWCPAPETDPLAGQRD